MLEARNIHKFYGGTGKDIHVLRGLDITVEEGAFVAIVGPSGAGKSTLLQVLGGLDAPSKGEVRFEGSDMYSLGDAALSRIRNKRIGFVFQFYHLLPEFSALENVLMPARVAAGDARARKDARIKAEALLEGVGLKERARHFPSQLSGGERQRLAIARALINGPTLLLCDEPTGNLDSETGNEIMALIRRVNEETKMKVVLVTHNRELAGLAQRVYHLKDGVLN